MSEARRAGVTEIVGPVLTATPAEDRPLLVALAERIAAGRYRAWADAQSDPGRRVRLLACAEREEEIARRVEALYPDAEGVQKRILALHGDLEAQYHAIFTDLALAEQLATQAEAERIGAATWRSFASQSGDPRVREAFEICAGLEEESATVLEGLASAGD